MAAWYLLCDFSNLPVERGEFISCLISEMNQHITETESDREPWVWIVDTTLNEISNGNFRHPFKFIVYVEDGIPHKCLLIRPKHIMAHLSHSLPLRETFQSLPIKTDRIFKKQLMRSGVVFRERVDTTIRQHRWTHMLALDLNKLEEFNLHAAMPDDHAEEDTRDIDEGGANV